MKLYLKALLVTAIAGAVILVLFSIWRAKSQSSVGIERISKIESMESNGVPAIDAKTIDGKNISLQSLKGKILIVNFWASWCGPCLEEFPSLISLVKKMKGKVALVAVSEDSRIEDIHDFLKAFPEAKSEGIYIIHDVTGDLGRAYNADRLPETFVLGNDLKLRKKIVGSIKWDTKEAVEYLTEVGK